MDGHQSRRTIRRYRSGYCALLILVVLSPLLLVGAISRPAYAAGSGDLLKDVPVVDENTLNNAACGAAAATMVLDYYLPQSGPIGEAIDIAAIARYVKIDYSYDAKTNTSKPVGTSYDELQTGIEAASTAPELGIGVPLKAAWHTTDSSHWFSVLKSELDAKRPIILFLPDGGRLGWSWHYGHFIVVSGYASDDSIIYHDPWDGKPHILSKDAFATVWGTTWDGNTAWRYMTVSPTTPAPPQTIDEAVHSKTNPYPPYTGQLVLDDPLDHDNGQWPPSALPQACVYQNGKYVLTAWKDNGGNAVCPGGPQITGDFTFQVETTFVYQSFVHPTPNDDGAAGIDFSPNNGGSDYFRCFINQQGVLSLAFIRPGDNGFYSVTKQIPGFKKDQPNLLAVVVVGEQVTVYLNVAKELTATIPNLGQGHMTLEVDFGQYLYVPSAAFQNAKLWSLSTPPPTPTPTQPLILEVKPSSFVASDRNICLNGQCEMTLSSPNSNNGTINWKATITIRPGAGTLIIGNVSPSSGILAPGQTITVSFIISSSICGDITGSTITFTGGVSPVVVQLSGSFGPC